MDFHREVSRIKDWYERYDKPGSGYDTFEAPFREREVFSRSQQLLAFSRLMRQIGYSDLAGLRILDVGCGNGRLLRSYLDMGADAHNLFGVDLSEERIDEGRRISPQITLQLCDGIHLNFPDAAFNLVTQYVVISNVLLPELRQSLADEMWRVLKPGGYVFWWDLKKTVSKVDGRRPPLDFEPLFPNVPSRKLLMRPTPKPSETLRSFPGVGLIGWLVDILAKRQTHVAGLIGPKE